MAPALSPVASLDSARRRMSSSFRMIGIVDAFVGQMLKPIVDAPVVGPADVTGPCRESRPVRIFAVYRSSGVTPSAFNCTSDWNVIWAYRFVFTACDNG